LATIEQITTAPTPADLTGLVELLQDVVDGGASIGFLLPLSDQDARSYWQTVIKGVEDKTRFLIVARENNKIIGSVQLELATKPNAAHRAEVQKLTVNTSMRGRGIGSQLMNAVEAAALDAGRVLLYLDTRAGDIAEKLYTAHGYTRAGAIPHYVADENGAFSDTVIFYRILKQ
jgi:acetyltransferase